MKILTSLTLATLTLLFAACGTTKNQRISQDEALFNTYTPAERKMIRTGQVAVGFDPDMVRMALGDPSRETTVDTAAGKQIAWEYRYLKPSLGVSVGGWHRHSRQRDRDRIGCWYQSKQYQTAQTHHL